LQGAAAAFGRRDPGNLERKLDIGQQRHPGEQSATLRHIGHVGVDAVERLAVAIDRAARGPFNAGDELEQRRFSGAARAEQADEGICRNGQIDVFERRH
jgi:hypothetical protein